MKGGLGQFTKYVTLNLEDEVTSSLQFSLLGPLTEIELGLGYWSGQAAGWAGDRSEEVVENLSARARGDEKRGRAGRQAPTQEPGAPARLLQPGAGDAPRLRVPLQQKPRQNSIRLVPTLFSRFPTTLIQFVQAITYVYIY